MSMYTKQDFSPPILSRRWLTIKFRPNMLIHNHRHILMILESGLLFREDCVEVEQEASSPEDIWKHAGGKGSGLTRGEGVVSLIGVALCVTAFPPRSLHRSCLLKLAGYASIPLMVRWSHRWAGSGRLAPLLSIMRDYLALARRAAACLKEYKALHATIESITSVIESTHALLCRQQSALCVCMSRASSALLGNVPWLRGDVAWSAVDTPQLELTKIHHAFLVVQSTLLKHIAMAHFVPPLQAQRIYKNHNERINWLHHTLIQSLTEEFKQNHESLERMYRLLRNIGNSDSNSTSKKPGAAMLDSWLYSDVHNGIARTCLELKLVSNKCNSIDVFLDSCALNKQELDLNILGKDIDELVDGITKCLTTVQNSQIRLKKIKNRVVGKENEVIIDEKDDTDDENIVKIDDKLPEPKDEVFYFVKTEDDEILQPISDVTTGPGKKERDATKIVFNELKRKLGKREDVMRERERQALVKTMPEYKESVPEFPRQIKLEEFVELKGFLCKIKKYHALCKKKKKLFRCYRISKRKRDKKYDFQIRKYLDENEIIQPYYKTVLFPNKKSILISITVVNEKFVVTKWVKCIKSEMNLDRLETNSISEDRSDIEQNIINNATNNNETNGHYSKNYKFSKKDLELSNSSSESDFEAYEEQMALLKDVRRHRVARKKKYPSKITIDKEDESLKPIEYSFGTGMAMASVLQINSNARMPVMVQEEVFIGDGEVSNDSGNDDDA
ncbi:unnamed protein product [Diatraea saccharalis]|uniref:Vezatin n=1 Tax=Diatraea saccharalis TaxID=40085 RepID=A0A9N9R5B6_9NEOP|nr:unnamed protein product [Diatraea saccharalis]